MDSDSALLYLVVASKVSSKILVDRIPLDRDKSNADKVPPFRSML